MPDTENVLGVNVSAVNMDSAIRLIWRWIDLRERHYVCVTGVHGVMESRVSSHLRRIHNFAGMVLPDGMPLAWLLRLGGHKDADRVCGPDLLPTLFKRSQARGVRHFFYGASDETLQRLSKSLRVVAPDAHIVGCHSPPFRALQPEEDKAEIDLINSCEPDIVWVGLSTPKQEYWMAEHRAKLQAPVLIGVGAAFDIQAGNILRAPKFLRRTGFEWTYRLFKEPRRLWRRYARSNPLFVCLIIFQKLGLVRYS